MKFLSLFLIFLCISSIALQAEINIPEQKAFAFYISGDYENYFQTILNIIEQNPKSPTSLFYISTLNIDKTLIKNYNQIFNVYPELLTKNNLDFFTRQIILSELVQHNIDICNFSNAQKLLNDCGFLQEWQYSKVYNYSYYNDINFNFENLENTFNYSQIKWKSLPFKTDYGWVPLNSVYDATVGTVYAYSDFYLNSDNDIILWLTSEASIKVYCDNKFIFCNDNNSFQYSLNSLFQITLNKGTHRILIKSTKYKKNWDFKIRILDKNGYKIIQNSNNQTEFQPIINKIQFKKIYPAFYTYFQNEINNNSKNPLDYFKLSFLDFYFFNENRALMNLLRYINAKVNNPFLNLLAGRIYLNKYYNTKNFEYLEKANTYFKSIIDSFPNFSKVKEYLCQYEIEKQDIKNTYSDLTKYFGTDFISSGNLWAEYFDLIHWENMKYKFYSNYLNYSPQHSFYRSILADYFKDIQPELSISYLTNLKNNNFSLLNKNSLLELYLKKLRIYKLFPITRTNKSMQ